MPALFMLRPGELVEALMLLGVAIQAGSGLWMLLRRAWSRIPRRPLFERLQAWSGAWPARYGAACRPR